MGPRDGVKLALLGFTSQYAPVLTGAPGVSLRWDRAAGSLHAGCPGQPVVLGVSELKSTTSVASSLSARLCPEVGYLGAPCPSAAHSEWLFGTRAAPPCWMAGNPASQHRGCCVAAV